MDIFIRAKSEPMAEAMGHINDNKHIFDGSYRYEISSIVSSVVLKVLSEDVR